MDEDIQQNPIKNGTRNFETRSGTQQKSIRWFLPHTQPINSNRARMLHI